MKDVTFETTKSESGFTTAIRVLDKESGSLIHADQLNLFSNSARLRLAEAICERLDGAIDVPTLEKRLLALCEDKKASSDKADAEVAELAAAQIIRPECFFFEGVSGYAVARQMLREGKPAAVWTWYLKQPDGKRITTDLSPFLTLDGRRAYVSPSPPAPYAGMSHGWSLEGRKAWIAGEPPPPPERLFEMMVEGLSNYLDIPAESAGGVVSTLACWVMLTYIAPAFAAVPYLLLSGPAGSGKSRVLELLDRMVFRPFVASNLTNAVLFRTLHAFGGTLLLDEAEQLRDNRSPEVKELMSSLLAGYRKGACVYRMEPTASGEFTIGHFAVYGPKAIACINEVPAPLASRCIQVPMFRSPPGSNKPKQRLDASAGLWQTIRDAAHATALDHGDEWPSLPDRAHVCPDMTGRNFEIWQPLLAIAEWFESHGTSGLLGLMQGYAMESIANSKALANPPEDEVLLRTLADLVQQGDHPTAKEVLGRAMLEDQSAFQRWSPKGVANHLRRYGLQASKSHGRLEFRPSVEDLSRIQTNYGIDLGLEEGDVSE